VNKRDRTLTFFYFLLCCNGRVLQHVRLVRFVQFSFESGNNSIVRKSSKPAKKREAEFRIQLFASIRFRIWIRVFPLMQIRIRLFIKLIESAITSLQTLHGSGVSLCGSIISLHGSKLSLMAPVSAAAPCFSI